jgi:hypothetical protein
MSFALARSSSSQASAALLTLVMALAATPAFAAAPAGKAAPAAPAAKAEAPAKVFGILIDQDGKRYELKGKSAIVGSGAGADVVIAEPTMAAKHARFIMAGSTVTLEDLGSKFGTLASGTLVSKGKPFRILQPMDLALGARLMRFEFGERPDRIEPTQKLSADKVKPAPAAAAAKPTGKAVKKGKGKKTK